MNVYESVTERIMAQLEQGVIPWRQEWKASGPAGLPYNYQSGKQYRGINILLLMLSGFTDARWLTYKQAQEIGAQVRRGERGTKIVFWSMFEKTSREGESSEKAERIPFMREYTVFNFSQCDGITQPLPFEAPTFEAIPHAHRIAHEYLDRAGIELRHGGAGAYYAPSLDFVHMPQPHDFHSPAAYYSTLFHELGHSTGHKTRLNRDPEGDHTFGSQDYSREELVAEFTAAFLCAECGISNDRVENNHAAYIQSWLKALKNDKKMCVIAAQRAQRAADLILNRTFEAGEAAPAEAVAA